MIDLKEYTLRYTCEAGVTYFGKRTCAGRAVLIHPETLEKRDISTYELRKKFKASKENKKASNKPEHSRPLSRSKKMHVGYRRDFNEYLNETEERFCTNF